MEFTVTIYLRETEKKPWRVEFMRGSEDILLSLVRSYSTIECTNEDVANWVTSGIVPKPRPL